MNVKVSPSPAAMMVGLFVALNPASVLKLSPTIQQWKVNVSQFSTVWRSLGTTLLVVEKSSGILAYIWLLVTLNTEVPCMNNVITFKILDKEIVQYNSVNKIKDEFAEKLYRLKEV